MSSSRKRRRLGLGAVVLLLAWTGLASCPEVRAETVRMAIGGLDSATRDYLEATAADFRAASPGIVVQFEAADQSEPAAAVVSSSDILVVPTESLAELVEAGLIEPLDPMMSSEFRSRFIPSLLRPGQIRGKTFALPLTASAYALVYNAKMFGQAGIAGPPVTWDDLEDAAERLKAAGLPGFGIPGALPGSDDAWFCALWTHAGELIGPDGRAAFASAAGVRSLALFRDLIARGLSEPDAVNANVSGLTALFANGGLAMLLLDSRSAAAVLASPAGVDAAVAPMPQGSRPATLVRTESLAIAHASHARQAAFKFVDFLFTKTPRMSFIKRGRSLPTTRAVLADPVVMRDKRLGVFAAGLADARSAPTVDGWDRVARLIAGALRSVYSGAASPAAALSDAAAQADTVLQHEDQPRRP